MSANDDQLEVVDAFFFKDLKDDSKGYLLLGIGNSENV